MKWDLSLVTLFKSPLGVSIQSVQVTIHLISYGSYFRFQNQNVMFSLAVQHLVYRSTFHSVYSSIETSRMLDVFSIELFWGHFIKV